MIAVRQAVYEHLLAHVNSVREWRQPNQDDHPPLPYGVITFRERPSQHRLGRIWVMSIWVYFPKGSYRDLDVAIEEIKQALDDKEVVRVENGEVVVRMYPRFTGEVSNDMVDEHLGCLMKRIDFEIAG